MKLELETEEWEKVYDQNMKTYIVDTKKEIFYKKCPKNYKKEKPIEKLELVRKEYIEYMKQFNNDKGNLLSRGY